MLLLFEWYHHWHCSPTIKESKGYCRVCMWNTGEDEQVHELSGQSRTQVGGILQDVLSKAGEY
jgi:hypothetical protein